MMRFRHLPSSRSAAGRAVATALFTAVAAAAVPASAQSQAVSSPVGMQGRVVSAAGRPLVAGVVALSTSVYRAKAETGVRGDFEFPDFAPGTATMRVSEPGYRTLNCPISIDPGHNYAVQAIVVRLGAAQLPCARAVTIHPET